MCGIVASVSERRDVLVGLAAIAHRGPDARGAVRRSGVTLGHARLAILDLDARSDQPLQRGSVTVSYNGELWNYRALRQELAADGCAFSTSGDTEVVAHALDRWGVAALRRFEGMFAVAWTDDDGALRLAPDAQWEIRQYAEAVERIDCRLRQGWEKPKAKANPSTP